MRHAAPSALLLAVLAAGSEPARAQSDGEGTAPGSALAELLRGKSSEPAPSAAPRAAGIEGGSAAHDLEGLAQELQRGTSVGAPVQMVALLDVARVPGVRGWLEAALAPRAPDWRALRAEVARVVASRFAVTAIAAPPNVARAAAALRDADDRAQIAEVNQSLGVDAILVAQVSGGWNPSATPRLELRLLAGRAPVSAYAVVRSAPLPPGLSRWNPAAVALLVIPLALFVLARRLGGGGSALVRIQHRAVADPSIVYTAYVARRALRGETSGRHVIASHRILGETLVVRGLPGREVWIAVRRVERDPKTLQVSSNEVQERSVQISRERPTPVSFEFKTDLTAVTLKLVQADGSPATEQALVVERGKAEAPRYVRGGVATLHVGEGEHVLLIGIDHRAYRVPVSVPPKTRQVAVTLDVAAPDRALFSGCKEAVPPFLNDDLPGTVEALERKGLTKPAAVLRAELHRARGENAEASRALESVGQLKDAAALRAQTDDAAGTAHLLLRSGDYEGAGHQLRRASDFVGAARAFVEARCWNEAVDCARQSGELVLLGEVLERKGDRIDAARIALELETPARAITLLQALPISDGRYGEGSLLLAELLLHQNEPVLALQKLDEAVQVLGAETALELREQIARALEQRGELALALEAYETIRKRDLQYPGAARKIDSLRAALKSGSGGGAVAGAKAVSLSARYDLEREIGRGGMGVVFRARDRTLGRIVALKRLPDNLREHPTAVKMFLREARSVAALNHPNIVTLFDAGQDDGTYYLTMEYLEGQPVNVLLERRKRLSARDAVGLALQVLEGLAYAHAEGIVHRDIKPSNLFVTQKGRVKIMDFGLAKTMEEVRKHASIIAGTPYYMAPEQALGQLADGRTDLYAFGVTLFELVTGGVPYKDGDVTYHHQHTAIPDMRERGVEVPEDLALLVKDLMAKRPQDRPATAGDVIARLKRLVKA